MYPTFIKEKIVIPEHVANVDFALGQGRLMLLSYYGDSNKLADAGGIVTSIEKNGDDYECLLEIVNSPIGRMILALLDAKVPYHIGVYGTIDADNNAKITGLQVVPDKANKT